MIKKLWKTNGVLLLAFGVLSGVLFSCREDITTHYFVYVNGSGHAISIRYYINHLEWTGAIAVGDSLTHTRFSGSDLLQAQYIILASDTAAVIFDNARRLEFSLKDTGDRNLLRDRNYQQVKGKPVYRYVFTTADYDKAVECEEKCCF